MVLDSPFSDLKKLCKEIVHNYVRLPDLMFNFLFNLIKSRIQDQAGFDINDVSPIELVSECVTPVLFIVAKNDELISNEHSDELFEK